MRTNNQYVTVIAVAVKLPVDLNNSMPQYADRKTKVASLAFMCTMMANFLPSLATMGTKELLTDIIALDILILESKYQAGHETALKVLELQQPGRLNVEKLNHHVCNYWIMAGTVTGTLKDYDSDYKWSIPVIFMMQFVGSLVGTIAPLCRCYAALSYKLSIKWIWNHIKVLNVESHWTQKLYDWKHSSIPFSVSSRKTRIVIQNFKVIFLIICIGLQKTVVVACKMIALIPIFFVICVLFFIRFWKWFKAMFSASSIVMGQNPEQQENFNDLRRYVLQLQDDMELSERTLKSISQSVNRLIKKAEKQPCYLVKLLRESKGFEGVGKYDSLHVPPLFAEDYLDCWSLPLVTLKAIAVSLPKIQNDIVDRLLNSVSEGLTYVTLVEESLNATDEYVSVQKAAKVLWLEVEVSNKWVGNNLKNHAPEVDTAGLILKWFKNTAKSMVTEVQVIDIRSVNDNSIYRVIEKRESSVNAATQLLGETTQIINTLQDRELPDLDSAQLPFIDKWRDYFNYPSP
ncbi:hypothetical protein Tco_0421327 [Tanacetum coccineum]